MQIYKSDTKINIVLFTKAELVKRMTSKYVPTQNTQLKESIFRKRQNSEDKTEMTKLRRQNRDDKTDNRLAREIAA